MSRVIKKVADKAADVVLGKDHRTDVDAEAKALEVEK